MAFHGDPRIETFASQFGARLRERRGDTPRWKLAAQTNLAPNTIARYERGENSPNLADAFKLAAALGCHLSELVPAWDTTSDHREAVRNDHAT